MSNTVDERVVKMQFDNTQFEQNVQTSIGTLASLKQALNFDKTSKPLEGLNEAVKNNNLPSLGAAVDAVGSRFSALEVVAITAISNITNSVVNKLKGALDAVTMRPLKDGFKEYETQMDSVQTIMANTGKGVGEVNASLDTMNTYADKTIYNFQEMAANLGRFTAAGTELETSQQAIMGISNLAAVSGSNSQKASVAMYQLSQAIAAGSLKLQDWNSVVNAGMGGKVFQDALQRTAQHMLDANVQVKDASGNMISYKEAIGGTTTSIKDMIAEEGSFRESLKNGWITTDVLTETLRQFQLNVETTEDYENAVKSLVESGYSEEEAKQIADMAKTAMDAATKVKTFSQLIDTTKEALGSGWTKTWQIIFGDFEEAKELWTGVSNVLNGFIDKTSDARNNLLQSWKDLGGRTDLIESFKNVFAGLQNVMQPITKAFGEVFKPLTGETLANATKRLRELTSNFKLSDEAASKLHDVFHRLFSIIHGAGSAFATLSKLIDPLVEVFKAFFGIFLDIVSELGQGLTLFSDTASQSDVLATAVNFACNALLSFAGIVRNAWSTVKEFYGTIKESFLTPGLTNAQEVISGLSESVISVKDKLIGAISGIKASLGNGGVFEKIKTVFEWIKEFAGKVVSALKDVFKQISEAFGPNTVSIFDNLINILTAGGIGLLLKNLFKLKGAFSISETIETFKEGIETLKDTLAAFQLKVKTDALLKIAIAVGVLALALLILSSIDPEKMNTGLKGMTAAIAELVGALSVIDKLKTDPKSMVTNATGMILISIAVAILAGAVKKLSSLNLEELGKGLVAVGVLLKMISQFLNGTYFENKGAIGSAIGILILSVAIRILATSVSYLGSLDLAVIGKGLLAIGILLAELGAFTKLVSGSKKMFSIGLSLIFVAASMKIFASAMQDFGSMDWDIIKKGLVSMGGVLLETGVLLNLMPKGSASKGFSLILIAASMLMVAKAFEKFGVMDWTQIEKGLGSMAGSLLIMSIALNLLPKGAGLKAFALVTTAKSLLIVGDVLEKFGAMEWDQIKKGFVAMGASLLELSIALNIIQGGIIGAIALLIVAAALAVLTPILITLGKLKWSQIGKGLLAIAGAFIVFGVVGAILGVLSPLLILFGLGLAAVAAGLVLLGASFGVVGVGLLTLARAITVIPAAINGIVLVLASLANQIVPLIGVLISKLLEEFLNLLPQITETIIAACSSILEIITSVAPMIYEAVVSILLSLLQVIADNIPLIVSAVVNIIVSILNSIRNALPTILLEIAGIIVTVLSFIKTIIPQIVILVGEIIVAFLNAVASQIPAIINAAFNLIIAFIDGLASAIDGNTDSLVKAIEHLMNAIINAAVKLLKSSVGTFLSYGGKLIKAVINGIKEHGPDVAKKVGEFLKKAISWIKSQLPTWLEAGKKLIIKIVNGIKENAPKVISKIGELIKDGLQAIKDKLPDWLNAGKDMIAGLISGIGEKASELVEKAKGVVGDAIQAAKNLLKINSPSKVFRSFGHSIDEGLIVGMDDMSDQVSKASRFVSEGLVSAAKKPLDHLADLFSGDIIDDPTITPVLDLSEIQNGTNRLYSMMNDAERYSFNGNVRLANDASLSISRDQRNKQQSENQMMGRLIDAINGLAALVGNTGNVYNVNGVTYDDGSNVSAAVRALIRAAKVEGRA